MRTSRGATKQRYKRQALQLLKRRKMYDIKAMAGYMKALKLLDTPTFLDKRTLWNPDPVPGMPDRASEVGYVAAAAQHEHRQRWRAGVPARHPR